MSYEIAALCVTIAVVGAAVQGAIGLGFGLLASPLLALIDTEFIPGAILVAILPLSATVAIASVADVDRRGAGLALAGRVPGVIAGAAVAAVVSGRALAIALAAVVLIGVALSIWLPAVRTTARLTVGAGVVSGFMGTATGVGGPPVALLWQRTDAAAVRATLSAYFAPGVVLSMIALTVAGDFTARQWRLGMLLLPGVLVGLVASRWLRRHVDGPRFRPILLGVSAASAVALLVEQL
ncbi:MAG: sulfite exporter TauE/SafE family protein [Acidimicrobiales bacterium]